MSNLLKSIGTAVLDLLHEVGGLSRLLYAMVRAIVTFQADGVEVWRSMYRVGVKSFPIVLVTAFMVGGITALQTAGLIGGTGATGVVGGATGVTTLREIGPILIGLMFSGRVGANNTAELGTMAVTDQIDALRALAINPINFLLAPRFFSIVIMMFLLTAVGAAVSIFAASGTIWLLIGLHPYAFFDSFITMVSLADFLNGMVKAAAFGAAIALVSCYYGFNTSGGAVGVGQSVNSAVVASATGIFVFDYLITALLP